MFINKKMNGNRFSLLAMDDEDVEVKKPIPIVAEPIKEKREWKMDDGKPAEVRKWNLEESKFERVRQTKKPFQRGYAFKEDRPPTRPMRGYSFKDESPPPQDTKKPTTPEEDFPKLSDYEYESHTPPYAPSDSPILTLASRIKQAMERQTHTVEETEQTLEMFSVIPMKTNLSGSLKFTKD
jgi:hypothetical protein